MEPNGSGSTHQYDQIEITVCPKKKLISIRDFGIGMDKEGLEHAVTIGWPKTSDLSGGHTTKRVSSFSIKFSCLSLVIILYICRRCAVEPSENMDMD